MWEKTFTGVDTPRGDFRLPLVRFPRGNIADFCRRAGAWTGCHPAANFVYAWLHDPVETGLQLGVSSGPLFIFGSRRRGVALPGLGAAVEEILYEVLR